MSAPVACTYILLAGLPGTGKSTLAYALAEKLNASGRKSVVLNKDDVRAALFPGEATDYSDAQNALCMEAMLSAAAYLRNQPAVPSFIFFDGRTFSRSAQIDQVISETEPGLSQWRILHLVCSDTVVQKRLSSTDPHPAADRSFALYLKLKSTFQPIDHPHLVVDTTSSLEHCVAESVAYLTESRL